MVESEIARLERAANPLDAGSEERVRRLAYLKRQRRALADVNGRKGALVGKFETCIAALESMKYDLLRLTTGSQNHHHVTNLAMEALHLADSVDSALVVADEVNRITTTRAAPRPTV
jgi:serine/threonine-protein kinase